MFTTKLILFGFHFLLKQMALASYAVNTAMLDTYFNLFEIEILEQKVSGSSDVGRLLLRVLSTFKGAFEPW